MTTLKAQTEIQQPVLYRCTSKATREVFYVVKSDSTDAWYTLRFDRRAAEWTCDCPAHKPCKHIRAVQEVLKIRRARLAEKIGGDMPAAIATIEHEQEVREEVAAATIAAAAAILTEARVKCSLNPPDVRKFEIAPSGRSVPMR